MGCFHNSLPSENCFQTVRRAESLTSNQSQLSLSHSGFTINSLIGNTLTRYLLVVPLLKQAAGTTQVRG